MDLTIDLTGNTSQGSQNSQRKSLKRLHGGDSQPFNNLTKEKVNQLLKSVLTNTKKDNRVTTIRRIISSTNDNITELTSTKKDVFLFSIKQLNEDLFTTSEGTELIGVLIFEVDTLDDSTLVDIIEFFIEGIKEGLITNQVSMELFPIILENIGRRESVTYSNNGRAVAGRAVTVNGLDLKSQLINSLFGCRWSPKCVLHVVNMSRDIKLLPDELKFLIEKLLRVMKSLPYDELPPLVHQLLVMSSKGHPCMILEGIISLFNNFNKQKDNKHTEKNKDLMEISSDTLYTIEGTVLLHINAVLTQNKNLRTEFFKGLKANVNMLYLSPFSVAIALCITKMSSHSETVFDTLKLILIKSFKDKAYQQKSSWMRELMDVSSMPVIEDIFITLVEQSAHGWDPVLLGLFNFAFELLDTFSLKISSAGLDLTSPTVKACSLGGTILIKCFKHHAVIRLDVLDQLINRILANATTCCVDPYISVVAEVSRSVPHVILDSVQQLKDCLNYINDIPSSSAIQLIQAILPLVQYKATVRDSLLIVLRKLLFSKKLECRLTAVGGYLLLLKHFKVLGTLGSTNSAGSSQGTSYSYSSQSQTLAEVHVSSDSYSGSDSLCVEILGILRRCLSQQDKVKLALYEGLYEVVCNNTKLVRPVLEMLLNQFKKYYEEDADTTPPVKLSRCSCPSVEHGHIRTEPLAHLVCCIQRCVRKCIELGEITDQILEDSQAMIESLVDRITTTSLNDYELDVASDYSANTQVGTKNVINATLLMSLYETLMDYVFSTGQLSQESCKMTLKLFTEYYKIHNLLSDKGVGGAGRRGSSSSLVTGWLPCLLPMASSIHILKSVFSDVLPAHQVPLSVLRENVSFVKYIVNIAQLKICQIGNQANPWEWGSRTMSSLSERNFESGCTIGQIFFEQLSCGRPPAKESGKKSKGKNVQLSCLEGFSQICHVVIARYSTAHVNQFLANVQKGSNNSDQLSIHDITLHLIKYFQSLVVSILTGSPSSVGYTVKDIICIMNIIKMLTDLLDPLSPQIKQVYEWVLSLCKEQSIDDINVVKNIVSFTLALDCTIWAHLKLVKKFSQDIHCHIGDIDEDVELGGSRNFAILNPRTAIAAVFTPLMDQIDRYLSDGIAIIKNVSTTSPDDTIDQETCIGHLCDDSIMLVLAFNELLQTTIPIGHNNESLMKSLTRLYGVFTEIAKCQLVLYSVVSIILPQFRKLVDNIGQYLSQQVYNYLLYVQETHISLGEQTVGTKSKGKKSAGPSNSGKTRVKREVKTIPNLIYSIEQFESILIKISKKSKVNLLDTFKRSVARDFRIKDKELEAIFNEQESGEEEEDKEKDTDLTPPVNKKAKR